MDIVGFLGDLGIHVHGEHAATTVNTLGEFVVVVLIALLVTLILRKWLSLLIWKLMQKKPGSWHEVFYQQRFFSKLSYLVAPVACYILLSKFTHWDYADILRRLLDIWLVIVCMVILFSLLEIINRIYDSYPVAKNRPITVFIQVFKVFIYTVAAIVIISILVNKSPEHLLVGVGAFAAVLLLVFRDSILGFVAGVQLIANKMVHIGDWIVMPSNHANGTVLEINLYTVKVQNWDMTISTIPTYQMVSQSFINWRGMQEAGVRQIARSIIFDPTSLLPCDDAMLDGMAEKYPLLKDYIAAMKSQKEAGHEPVFATGDVTVNGTIDTNLGLFRAYAVLYLRNNPHISQEQLIMVRAMAQNSTGVPVQVWCFTNTTVWPEYEAIQSAVFEQLMLVAGDMKLAICDFVEVAIQQQVQASGAISVSK